MYVYGEEYLAPPNPKLGVLHDLITKHHSGNQIKKNDTGVHVASMGERQGAYRVLMGTSEGNRQLGRSM
jgi:hypothetical protein